MNRLIKPTALALALALAGAAIAQSTPTTAQQKEIDAARADLDKAMSRLTELHRKYGGGDAPMRIERRVLRKPVIGVLLAPDEAAGVRIAGVTPDSAAAAGGLKSGDRIVSIDGKPLKATDGATRVEETRERLAALDAKTPVKLGYQRDGKTQVVTLTPKLGDRLLVMPDGDMLDGDVQMFSGGDGDVQVMVRRAPMPGGDPAALAGLAELPPLRNPGDHPEWAAAIAPEVHREVIRLGSDCKGDDCALPVLAEAFRWNGLNLAAVDASLGRYFGSNEGVLVLSTGKDLQGLQAGDVIRSIGGKEIATPREAMDALRAQPAGGKVTVDYLRDRTPGTAQVSVPESLQFTLPMAAIAPRAPGSPGTVERRKMVLVGPDGKVQTFEDGDDNAPPARMPKDGTQVERRRYVMVDKDGKRTEWEGDAGETPPAWVQAMPQDARRRQVRKIVTVDASGKATEIETDDLPPPPAPPAPPVPPPPPPRAH